MISVTSLVADTFIEMVTLDSTANTPSAQLLNPNTPLAWVTPREASKLTHHHYASIWALSVLSWDIASHISDDYKLLTQYRINHSVIVYCISRLTSLAYVLGLVITTTTPIGNCNYIRYVTFIYPLTLPVTLLLFVFRVCALYGNKKYVVALFSLTWLSVLGSAIAFAIYVEGIQIGPTEYCFEDKPKLIASLGTLLPAAHDALVFLATSWAFMRHSLSAALASRVKEGFNIMVWGRHLPAFSKSLLRDGQAYYLATLVLTFCIIGMYCIPDPIITPCTFAIPLFALMNNMSCYVYRNMRFGFYRDEIVTTAAINRALEGAICPPIKQLESLAFKAASDVGSTLDSLHEGSQIGQDDETQKEDAVGGIEDDISHESREDSDEMGEKS